MSTATLTEKGQVVIPAKIRARHGLTPGTQVEFVDEGGVIRLVVRRRVAPSDPAAGYGMVKVEPRPPGAQPRKLSDFDPATLLRRAQDDAK
ncbi:MAG: AbrB/MazE/SpoVT family DNA-binding domain-containing protein [Burkholderiales bacterium]